MTPPHQEQRCGLNNTSPIGLWSLIEMEQLVEWARQSCAHFGIDPNEKGSILAGFMEPRSELAEWEQAVARDLAAELEAAPNPPTSDPHETWTLRICPDHGLLGAIADSPEAAWCCARCRVLEVVPASTLQLLTAERDSAIKRAERAEYFLVNDGPGSEADHLQRIESAEQKLSQLQAAHRADLERVAGELEELAADEIDGIDGTGSIDGFQRRAAGNAFRQAASLISSLSTKDTDEAQ